MNLEKARFNMVHQQVQTWDVLDQRVLDVMSVVPREAFVPEGMGALAYADTHLPLDDGQVMMCPREEARLLQALAPQPTDKVLEVGTGSGYLTTLLARLAGRVVSVEISARLKERAVGNVFGGDIGGSEAERIDIEHGDASRGWEREAPYDVIAVTGSVPTLVGEFVRQLEIGGRLFIIVGEAPAMEALLIAREADDDWSTESLFETVLPALEGVIQPQRFVL